MKKIWKYLGKKKIAQLFMAVLMFAIIYVIAGKIPVESTSDVKSGDKKTVVIDAGHGGVDGGAESVLGYSEKDINLAIALKLREKLEERDIRVIMTRDKDEGLYSESDTNKKVSDMKKRCEIVNESKADFMISIHQNKYSSEGVKGAQVFYYTHSQEGKKAAEILQSSLKEALDKNNGRQAKANDNYYILINVECPAVIAECGFVSNYEEAELLNNKEYQEKTAIALCEGICTYFNEK